MKGGARKRKERRKEEGRDRGGDENEKRREEKIGHTCPHCACLPAPLVYFIDNRRHLISTRVT